MGWELFKTSTYVLWDFIIFFSTKIYMIFFLWIIFAGMVFNISVGFSDISAGDRTSALFIGDTVLVNEVRGF